MRNCALRPKTTPETSAQSTGSHSAPSGTRTAASTTIPTNVCAMPMSSGSVWGVVA